MDKNYALKIEGIDHGLIFHMVFTDEEFKNTKIGVGSIEVVIKKDKQEEHIIDSHFLTAKDLYELIREKET